jgi:type IV fimbrial biogenesis protein FimT
MLRRLPYSNGFTLIELIVAVTVISILLVAGIPAFTSWVANAQVRTVTDGIANGLRMAQAEASRRNRQVQFILTSSSPAPPASGTAPSQTPSSTGTNWVIVTVPMPLLTDPSTGTTEIAQYVQGSNLANVATNIAISGPATLTFNSFGLVTSGITNSSSATYTVTRVGADHPLDVLVSVGGQVRVCDPGIALSSSPEGCT